MLDFLQFVTCFRNLTGYKLYILECSYRDYFLSCVPFSSKKMSLLYELSQYKVFFVELCNKYIPDNYANEKRNPLAIFSFHITQCNYGISIKPEKENCRGSESVKTSFRSWVPSSANLEFALICNRHLPSLTSNSPLTRRERTNSLACVPITGSSSRTFHASPSHWPLS